MDSKKENIRIIKVINWLRIDTFMIIDKINNIATKKYNSIKNY